MEVAQFCAFVGILLIYLLPEVKSQLFSRVRNVGPPIQCHTCWTKEHPECGHWSTLRDYDNRMIECRPKDNVCKKLVTKYYKVIKYGRDVEYQLLSNVTSRFCGQADWTGCRTIRGAASWTTECACEGDFCNSTQLPVPSFFLTALVSVLATGLLHFYSSFS